MEYKTALDMSTHNDKGHQDITLQNKKESILKNLKNIYIKGLMPETEKSKEDWQKEMIEKLKQLDESNKNSKS